MEPPDKRLAATPEQRADLRNNRSRPIKAGEARRQTPSMASANPLQEGIAKGEKAISEGRILSDEGARARMARWLD
ncbi:hypothetical protein JIN84_09130 [Luteolibacter yonseiensis]|uniref:Uncharacterized protein n=1 Tax=Luteolibacter yonseiensis TaxID=1144680 RepID=A0A934R5Z8_9BACT|nr:hypothetical protein [Luteolibacter yonseiensis]MBK1815779.1 hypothetical protein [Luteolibacter yonseiensis]